MTPSIRKSLKQAFVLSTLALAGATAWADDITLPDPITASTLSRAEVQAELRQAIADGSLQGGGELALQRQPAMRLAVMMQSDRLPMARDQGAATLIAQLYGAP